MSLNIFSPICRDINANLPNTETKSGRISARPKKFEGFEMIRNSAVSSSESGKRKRFIVDESPIESGKKRKIDQVICRGFNIETPVTYLRSMSIDPDCEEALAKAWEDHVAEQGVSSDFTKEEKKYIACIEGVADDGSDQYAQKYEIKESKTPGAGNGLFARADGNGYKKDDVIDLYGGRLTFAKNVENKEYAFEWPDTPFAAFSIDGRTEGNALRFMNHASPKKANVSSVEFFYKGKPYIFFIADKQIFPGDEMYYDYGPEYWIKKGIEPK